MLPKRQLAKKQVHQFLYLNLYIEIIQRVIHVDGYDIFKQQLHFSIQTFEKEKGSIFRCNGLYGTV
jgi:hypothetical protein